ncbi:MAG: IS630 family transposase [Eubacteriaceae bacterium]|nr:IS630 family transposase [Eubacteriaceae bacterium]
MAADLDSRTRNNIIEYHKEGLNPSQIAKTLKLAVTSVRRIIDLFNETGSVEPRPRTYGPKPVVSDEKLDEAVLLLKANPSMSIKKLLIELGLSISETTMREALRSRRGITYKKKTGRCTRQKDEDVAQKRADMINAMPLLDAGKLKFLDETTVNASMAKEYGWGAGRVEEHAPDPRGTGQTLVSAVGLEGIIAPFMFKGAMNKSIFLQYLEQSLIPLLPRGSILVMDNLSSHASLESEALLLGNGIVPLRLPPYSPEFNVIEFVWQIVKDHVKNIKPRDSESLCDAVGAALGSVTQKSIKSIFLHCGYVRSIM